jgi:hypothetical protein
VDCQAALPDEEQNVTHSTAVVQWHVQAMAEQALMPSPAASVGAPSAEPEDAAPPGKLCQQCEGLLASLRFAAGLGVTHLAVRGDSQLTTGQAGGACMSPLIFSNQGLKFDLDKVEGCR